MARKTRREGLRFNLNQLVRKLLRCGQVLSPTTLWNWQASSKTSINHKSRQKMPRMLRAMIQQALSHTPWHTIDQLEPRLLMSAYSLTDRTLQIISDDAASHQYRLAASSDQLTITEMSGNAFTEHHYALSALDTIHVIGSGGDDTVIADYSSSDALGNNKTLNFEGGGGRNALNIQGPTNTTISGTSTSGPAENSGTIILNDNQTFHYTQVQGHGTYHATLVTIASEEQNHLEQHP